MKVRINNTYYFQITSINFSGNLESPTRTLRVSYLDYYQEKEKVNCNKGDKVELFTNDDNLLFTGMIYALSNNTGQPEGYFIAKDEGRRLSRNYLVKNYKDLSPSEITKQVCAEIKVNVGTLPLDKLRCSFPAIDKSAYDIILTAYTLQHNKDKILYSVMADEKNNIIIKEQGEIIPNLIIERIYNDTNFNSDIYDMVNQMAVYESENNQIQIKDKAQNLSDINKYGVFQDVMRYDENRNNIYDARSMLFGENEKINIRVKGDYRIKSGYSLVLKEPISKLYGKFYISSDNHMWESNNYYTDVELLYESTMTKVEADEFIRRKEATQKVKKWDWVKGYGGDNN